MRLSRPTNLGLGSEKVVGKEIDRDESLSKHQSDKTGFLTFHHIWTVNHVHQNELTTVKLTPSDVNVKNVDCSAQNVSGPEAFQDNIKTAKCRSLANHFIELYLQKHLV